MGDNTPIVVIITLFAAAVIAMICCLVGGEFTAVARAERARRRAFNARYIEYLGWGYAPRKALELAESDMASEATEQRQAVLKALI